MAAKNIFKAKGFKYILATVVFLVVILFVDQNNLIVTHRLGRQVKDLHQEEQRLRQGIIDDSIANAALLDNPDIREHYGRENYYFKRSNEDVFVIK